MTEMLRVERARKTFTLHTQGGIELPVYAELSLSVSRGECLLLTGASGSGKSSLLRTIYGNYRCPEGRILIEHRGRTVDIASAAPQVIRDVRRRTLGYVSQFLRVVPRVATLEIVIEPLLAAGIARAEAEARAAALLTELRVPERLWRLPPATFSGGEQQRVNIARGFAVGYPVLLLDEPTASLDRENRRGVIALIERAKASGAAILGIFHDGDVREAVGTASFDVEACRAAA